MFRSPCCGPLLGNGSKRPDGSSRRSSVANRRSCGEPAGRCPTATCRSRSDQAAGPSKRSGDEVEPSLPPQEATASSASASIPAPTKGRVLRRLLALALDSRLRGDRRHGRLLMATGTIPDHICLRDPLLDRLGLDLGPGELRLREVIPAREIQRFECALEGRPPVLLRAKHRPDHLELLVAEPDDPHVASSDPNLNRVAPRLCLGAPLGSTAT